MKSIRAIFLLLLLCCFPISGQKKTSKSPVWGIKTNLLYDLTSSINLGAEARTSHKFSFDLSLNYNPWNLPNYSKLKHLLVQPELRYWLAEPFTAHFLGVHAIYTSYNIGGIDLGSMTFSGMDFSKLYNNYFQGSGIGLGIAYGYDWDLAPHWKFEASVGVGFLAFNYSQYECRTCGDFVGKETSSYLGPTKLGLSLVYTLGTAVSTKPHVVTGIQKKDLFPVGYKAPQKKWLDPAPYGMVFVERGVLTLGNPVDDPVWEIRENQKTISIESFWMDATEVTNEEYRQFIYWVRDSIIRERLFDPAYGANEAFKITEDADGNLLEPPILNWKQPIPTEKKANEEELRALRSVYRYDPITETVRLDPLQMIYRYEVYDAKQAALRRNNFDPDMHNLNSDLPPEQQVMISKDTAYISDDGRIVRETITRPLSGPWDFMNTYIVNIHPDETAWVNDFYNSYNEPYMRQYFTYSGYDDYPVVGVSWDQAQAFCNWRTMRWKQSMGASGNTEAFRLPTEAEWEYAARGGKTTNLYPWEQMDVLGCDDCFLGNFKQGDGDYLEDGFMITAKVASFMPNELGLYDMAGNVSEWTSTTFSESGFDQMNDINPEIRYSAAREDPYMLKRKTVRGGSWKDVAHSLRSDVREFEYQNEHRSYIGFRCVRSIVGQK